MATYTPPPYFPQSSLSPPNKNRYLKFRLLMVALSLALIALVGAFGYGIWYVIRLIF